MILLAEIQIWRNSIGRI